MMRLIGYGSAKKGYDKEQKTVAERLTKAASTNIKGRTGLRGTGGFMTKLGSTAFNSVLETGLVENTEIKAVDIEFITEGKAGGKRIK